MAFATVAQFLNRYRPAEIGDYVSNDGNRVSETGLATDLVLLAALESATSEIKSAAFVADKYQPSDLDDLTTAGDAFLLDLTSDLAMARLLLRVNILEAIPPQVEEARKWLAMLRLGERIFNVDENKTVTTRGFLTTTTISELNLARDHAGRFFPGRNRFG